MLFVSIKAVPTIHNRKNDERLRACVCEKARGNLALIPISCLVLGMASLYDDIDLKSTEKRPIQSGVDGWTSGVRLLQSQVQLRKATAMKGLQNKSRPSQSPFIAPVADLSSKTKEKQNVPVMGSLSKTIIEPDLPLPWGNYKGTTLEKSSTLLFGEIEIEDEYNPLLPNDYDLIRKQRGPLIDPERQRSRDRDERGRRSRERNREKSPDDSDEDEEAERDDDVRLGGIAIAPPTALIEEDKKVFEEPQMPPPPASGGSKGLGVAARIMEKYGYRQGQGLGKQEQGMSTALQVEKVSKTTGKIIHERDRDGQPVSITEILKNPTKVVLLQNMVGPGEVDAELEPEIQQECSKYGDVYGCTVYEVKDHAFLAVSKIFDPVQVATVQIVPNPACDEDAVRVFLEFAKVEQAIKAVVDLNGRYFGGRMVKAAFYDVDRYRRRDLALDA